MFLVVLLTVAKIWKGLPWSLCGKESTSWYRGVVGSIPGSGRSPGEGNDNPLKFSFLGNPIN